MDAAELLRGQPVLAGPLPGFDVETAPDGPGELFVRWLEEAIRGGVAEPHVMTLSTADARGRPSSRVLMLRDVDTARAGWVFASSVTSRKGVELTQNPWAALCLYWREQGRQVRVEGPVIRSSAQASAREFLTRSPQARLAQLTGQQSAPMVGAAEFAEAEREARAVLQRHPEAIAPDYASYTLFAEDVEFWQGDTARHHVRLRYTRAESGWNKQLLWP